MVRLTRFLPALALVAAGISTVPAAAAGDTSPPSAIGNEAVIGIAVSPAYQSTGLVVASAANINNNKEFHLFVSHDGGATWGRATATGWNNTLPTIAADGTGHEILYAGDKSSLLRSDNYGDTWSKVGAPGTAYPSSQFAKDGLLAVTNMYSNGTDYMLQNGSAKAIAGSGGTLIDHQYAFSSSYPAAGKEAAVLLAANDPKSGYPEVLQCSASFTCSSPGTTLPGSTTFAGFANLSLSSTYNTDGVVFAQSSSSLDKSSDGGKTFTPMVPLTDTTAAGIAYTGLVADPRYSESGSNRTVYAAEVLAYEDKTNPHTESGVFRSTNGGTTWTREGIGTHLADNTNSLAIAPDGRLFASFVYMRTSPPLAGLLCSSDGGNTWQTYCSHVGNYKGPQAAGGVVTPGVASKGGSSAAGGSNAAGGSSQANGANNGTQNGQSGQNGSGNNGSAPTGASVQPKTARNLTLTIILIVLAALFTAVAVLQRRRSRRGSETP